jgi:hypothetical protein
MGKKRSPFVNSSGEKIWSVIIAVFLVILAGIAMISVLLVQSLRLREFKVDVFVLCNESDICVATGPEGKVKIHTENLPAIYALVKKAHGRIYREKSEPLDSVNFAFDCHEESWDMQIDKMSDEILRIKLTGPREYELYTANRQSFEEFAKVASVKGYKVANKLIGVSKDS